MSKFTKALEQAQRERALRLQAAPPAPPAAPPAPPREAHSAPREVPSPPREVPTAPREVASPPRPAPRPRQVVSPPRRMPAPPRRASEGTGELDSHLVSLVAPASLEAEQYRALRHMVEQRHKNVNLSVLAVSSPGVGDGKTTTAINLAGALAQGSDASVLLVEADLRRPSIAQLLGFSDSPGMGLVDAILDPRLTLADIVQPRTSFSMSVVLAGQTPPSPYEVLKSPRLGALLDEAREQYDYIVMDTPPLAPVQDCRVVARWVDGVLVVVAADHTPRALLEAALDVLDPTKVIGLVFNGYDHLKSARYARQYVTAYADSVSQSSKPGSLRRAVRSLLRRGERRAGKNRPRRDRSR
jgi:protein-tyrosine kinase